MKKGAFLAVACVALVACSSDGFIGDKDALEAGTNGAIVFKAATPAVTRAPLTGSEAASNLNSHFVVYGTKHCANAEDGTAVNDKLVFNQYNLEWTANSAGTSTTNTHGWEYVGKNAYSAIIGTQGAKYWDYAAAYGYTFYAFSSSDISYPALAGDLISIAKTTSGPTVYDKGYQVTIKPGANFSSLYLSDRLEVAKTAFGNPVTFTFRNFASKVRVGFYETVPGYSVKIDRFYYDDNATAAVTTFKAMDMTSTSSFKASIQNVKTSKGGTVTVSYYNTGDVINRAKVTNSTVTYDYDLTLGSNLIGNTLGTTSATATYDQEGGLYTWVFPFHANSNPMLIRCDYTLTADDGQGETIKVKNARVVVPLQYVQWNSNCSYTYLFKISDNGNGTTGTTPTDPDNPSTGDKEGIYPISFDAVAVTVDEMVQTTYSTLSTNSVTTYAKDGYVKSKDIYVVNTDMSSHAVIAPSAIGNAEKNAQVYKVTTTASGDAISEATVYAKLTGADNGLTLTALTDTEAASIVSTVPAADGNNYSFTNAAVKFTPAAASTSLQTYAYVYCTTAYVAAQYEAAGESYDSGKTYYFKTTDGVYYAASGLSSSNYATYKSQLFTLKTAAVPGVYDIMIITVAAE